MKLVNIHEAKTHLSRLVEQAGEGEEIVIAKSGEPKAKLVAVKGKKKPRPRGLMKGKIRIHDDFDAPLPAALLKAFDGG
jgi:prevent-host-death family protein